MLVWPGFDPVALRLGPLAIHWYGLMYIAGFTCAWFLVRKQLREAGWWGQRITRDQYENLFTWLVLGIVLGGRMAYVIFYNLGYYLEHPLDIVAVWHGGMSFHGGLLGALVSGWWFCRRAGIPFLGLADRFFIVAPLGLAFGRFGNFINGELWGRVTDVPWGMVFPGAGPEPRHPSQLYELSLEGLLLFVLLWSTRKVRWPDGTRVALFLIGYALARIFCEQFRQPDPQIGFLMPGVTMGMVLSFFMLAGGVALLLHVRRLSRTSS